MLKVSDIVCNIASLLRGHNMPHAPFQRFSLAKHGKQLYDKHSCERFIEGQQFFLAKLRRDLRFLSHP
jgi:hypothetical protein